MRRVWRPWLFSFLLFSKSGRHYCARIKVKSRALSWLAMQTRKAIAHALALLRPKRRRPAVDASCKSRISAGQGRQLRLRCTRIQCQSGAARNQSYETVPSGSVFSSGQPDAAGVAFYFYFFKDFSNAIPSPSLLRRSITGHYRFPFATGVHRRPPASTGVLNCRRVQLLARPWSSIKCNCDDETRRQVIDASIQLFFALNSSSLIRATLD